MGRHTCSAPLGVNLHLYEDGKTFRKLGEPKRITLDVLQKIQVLCHDTSVTTNSYICTRCYFEVTQRYKELTTIASYDDPVEGQASDNDDLMQPGAASGVYPATVVSSCPESMVAGSVFPDPDTTADVNKVMSALQESPFIPSKSKSVKYVRDKVQKTTEKLALEVARASKVDLTPSRIVSRKCRQCNSLIEDITKKFKLCNCKDEQYRMLSTFPQSVTIDNMVERVGCSKYQARKASSLRTSSGAFSTPPKSSLSHYKISQETKDIIIQFYFNPANSRVSPEFRKTINVLNPATGKREPQAKHQMLVSQKQFYDELKLHYPEMDVSLSTVAMLKPKQCKWGGMTGFLNTCVCEIHQNFELLINALSFNIKTDKLLKNVLCETPLETCYLGACNNCPNWSRVLRASDDSQPEDEQSMQGDTGSHIQLADGEELEDVEYYYWIQNELIKKTNTKSELAEEIEEQLPRVGHHHFLMRQQQTFLKDLENRIKQENTSMIVHMDFAENYSFVVQNAIQGHHWTNNQMTIHPFYCMWSSDGSTVSHRSYVIMSDTRDHAASTIEYFRRKLLEKIQEHHPEIEKIYYVSDGTGAKYKNYKNLINLMYHQKDYGINIECHYTVSYHGKSQCDAIAAVVKKSLRIASMRDAVKILTAQEAFDYCVQNVRHLDNLGQDTLAYIYISKQEVSEIEASLDERYSQVKTIPGTRGYHSFIPISDVALETRPYSLSTEKKVFYFGIETPDVDALGESLTEGMYVCIIYRGTWQLGLVESKDMVERDAVISIMKKLPQRNNFLTSVSNPLFHVSTGIFRMQDLEVQRVQAMFSQAKLKISLQTH